MVGIGPLITIPLVLASLHGGLALTAWLFGALIALCDGLVWAELSSRHPGSGGTYVYLREAFGRDGAGRLFAFLFNWQFIFFAPLLLASGYIGFAQYAGYFFPVINATPWIGYALRVCLGVAVMALLYQRITSVAKLSIGLGITAVVTLLCVIAASLPHANFAQALSSDMHPAFNGVFVTALGAALIFTVYDYVGYADVALIGDEVIAPNRTIPLAIIFSVIIVGALYVVMQVGILGVVPWQSLLGKNGGPPPDSAQYVAATVIEHAWGRLAAGIVTILVLITAFASLYGNLLGFSRIPFAAARDGIFFPVFRHLHKTGAFPNVSLLVIGVASIVASFLSLGDVINYLTAGIVLIQGVAQIVALAVMRSKGDAAPFRMWLYPLPAIVALIGWIYLFVSSGSKAMLFGTVTLICGVLAFVLLARAQRTWPFISAIGLAIAFLCCSHASARAAYGHSAIVQQRGYPVFEVDRKPFFVYGAAFFYERVPRSRWRASLEAYKRLGINTIDLYLIWNWHELADGDFDFTGRTNARRDLPALFSLIHELGFKTILRPGPVIRNEWKNGGYPDWLLRRREYNMPLHDVLEGRYPATATFQNAHSDDAAAEWMNNRTHIFYATRWLQRVLTVIKPWSSGVIAIALDDDQGAYIDNQTWPAPHFQAYLKYLESTVHAATGPSVPAFINTYQMKVTASSPVWAWGNWYQSDAYSIGEHDRSQLEFSTGLLQTQPDRPAMVSEFQAGWLQGADETRPRAADPTNTELALGTILQMGAHGVVNFPVQDTLNPSGYEAPFANASYAWDAALSTLAAPQPRWMPTATIGALIKAYGRRLAQTHPLADAAIAWKPSSLDPAVATNRVFADAAAQVIAAQQWCRANALTCDVIDPHFATPTVTARYRTIIDPQTAVLDAALAIKLRAASALPDGESNLTVLADNAGRFAFIVATNYGTTPLRYRAVRVRLNGKISSIATIAVPSRSTRLFTVATPRAAIAAPTAGAPVTSYTANPTGARTALAYAFDEYEEGAPAIELENSQVRVVVAPNAGARAFIFEDLITHRNVFTSIGALRDDVANPLAPSSRDYIAKYTHQFEAGTFNRPYRAEILESGPRAAARFSYEAPDLITGRAIFFTRTLQLEPGARTFTVDIQADRIAPTVSINSLTVGNPDDFKAIAQLGSVEQNGIGFYDAKTKELATMSWRSGDVSGGTFSLNPTSALVVLEFPPGGAPKVTYGYLRAANQAEAQRSLDALRGR